MKVFVDANVLVSVLNKEYPLFSHSARILSLNKTQGVELYTSPLCLSIAFYFSSKKSGEQRAKKKIEMITEHIGFTSMDESIVRAALGNPRVHDFEDGMQYYSAIDKGCRVILTEDRNDYYFSEIEVLGCSDFITKYFSQKT